MEPTDLFDLNRVILCHFDSYSTALVFARWSDRSLLWPAPLPAAAQPMPAPADPGAAHDHGPVMQATVERCGLDGREVVAMDAFDEWLQADAVALRVHLLRFTTFEAPAPLIAPHGGVFKPISELRGSNATELQLLRRVFNLIIGGDSGRR